MQAGDAINAISKITGHLLKPLTCRLTAKSETPRVVSLVLSGGGARTFAQIGVIRAMEEAGIRIEMAGGTSGGASSRRWSRWDGTLKRFAEQCVDI